MDLQTEYTPFKIALKNTFSVLKDAEPLTNEKIDKFYQDLKHLPLNLVLASLALYESRNKFTPTPSDILDCSDELLGITAENLKNTANKFFDQYLVTPIMRHDVVIEDVRIAKAFKDCFEDFERFTSGNRFKKINDYRDSEDRKRFVEAVIANKRLFNVNNIPHVFKGIRNLPKQINVAFIGNYQNCKALARQYYATTGEDQQYFIVYPIDPALRIEQKAEPKREFTEAHKKNQLNWVLAALKNEASEEDQPADEFIEETEKEEE